MTDLIPYIMQISGIKRSRKSLCYVLGSSPIFVFEGLQVNAFDDIENTVAVSSHEIMFALLFLQSDTIFTAYRFKTVCVMTSFLN